MKPAIRMIAVDLDGTLLNSQKRISQEDLEALQAAVERGVEVVPVTGRNYSFALPIVQTLPFAVAMITSNGAVIRSSQGETFLRRLLAKKTAAAVLEATRRFRPYTVLMYDQAGGGQLRIEELPAASSDSGSAAELPTKPIARSAWVERNRSLVEYFRCLDEALEGDPLEVMFAGPVAAIRQVEACLQERFSGAVFLHGPGNAPAGADGFCLLRTEYSRQDFSMLDVINNKCSKGRALDYWGQCRGFRREQIMAIGDNFNDLEMLRLAGLPVVMGNADETLKAQNWTVTLDCDSSGVAHAIRKYVL